jgi:hypothetical protein
MAMLILCSSSFALHAHSMMQQARDDVYTRHTIGHLTGQLTALAAPAFCKHP